MEAVRFKASLRIRHPSLEPSEISRRLSLVPAHSWGAGDQRRSPNGTSLGGVHRETYWTAPLRLHQATLEGIVGEACDRLSSYRAFFAQIRGSGGRVELFVGCFEERNWGAVLDADVLLACGELGLELALDVYPPEIANRAC